MDLNQQICKAVKRWKILEVPYEHRGFSRNGCDCTGLIIGVLKEMGYIKSYRPRSYSLDWNLHSGADNYIVDVISKVTDEIKNPKPGDAVLFYFGRCVAHAGVVIENGLFVHCNKLSKKCRASSLWNSPWTKRIFSFYRFNESKLKAN